MGVFRFKKFEVINERSAMKVNTDGVLLGAAMTITPHDRCLLDIGTGTGTIALMAAQRVWDISAQAGNGEGADWNDEREAGNDASGTRNDIRIDAIDVDEPSATEAAANFRNSTWADSMTAYNMPLNDFAAKLNQADEIVTYDLIFSNPPYFEDSLTAPDERKSTARHTSEGLSYRDIFEFASKRLSEQGRVALVLPAEQEAAVCRYARMCSLHLHSILRVRTVPRKAPSRMIVEFGRQRKSEPSDSILTIQNEGQYTQEYLSLTSDFYLFA